MDSRLKSHKEVWSNKPIIREIYKDWYRKILKNLSRADGPTIELGAGSGNFKEFMPESISSDIEKCDWLDMCFDAHSMPFKDSEVSNIVMIDVLHHLASPVKFLEEALRVLKVGGRIIMIEPFPSPFSSLVYKKFHPEPFMYEKDYFDKSETGQKDPWDSNQAIAYLLFYKNLDKFNKLFGGKYKILIKQKFSFLLYPASGGFENKQLIPDCFIPLFKFMEWLLIPLKDIIAFRCFIVLEKVTD